MSAARNPAEVLGTFNRVYGLSAAEITQVYGGTVGYTYTVEENFLKIYDKTLSVTPRCTEFLGERLAALRYLQDYTPLRGRICYPLKTAGGRLFYEDGQSVYVAFNRIPGAAIGWERELDPDELEQVAELVAALHQVEVKGPLCSVPGEKFELGFCDELEALITGRALLRAPRRFLSLMQSYEAEIRGRAAQAKSLARSLAERGLPFVLCHTDIHGGNLMKDEGGRLFLIDWENLILAPKEADLFSFCESPSFARFGESASADGEALLYYLIRRDLEDIWEFLRTLLYDGAAGEEQDEIYGHMTRICGHLKSLSRGWAPQQKRRRGMAKVLLLCGKICCGKSTYCKKIKGAHAVVLSCDDLMMKLFDEQLGDRHAEVSEKTKAYLKDLSLELLNAGVDVILDWGFWKQAERREVRDFYRQRGVDTELHYLKISDAEWDRRIEKRNRERTPGTYFVDGNMKALFGAAFEEPGGDEAPIVIES